MALVTTFATTPIVSALYPPWYQAKLEAWKRGEIDWDGNRLIDNEKTDDGSTSSIKAASRSQVSKLLVHLRLDTMPGVLGLVAMLSRPNCELTDTNVHPSKKTENAGDSTPTLRPRPLQVHGIRLKELTDRDSSVMAVTDMEEYSQHDHVLNTFRTFGQFSNVAVRGQVLLSPPETYASTFNESASTVSSDLMLLSWTASGSMSENQILPAETVQQRFENSTFSHFLYKTVSRSTSCNTAIFVDNGFGSRRNPNDIGSRRHSVRNLKDLETNATIMTNSPPIDQSHHIFLPFFGTEDDRVALQLVLQLAQNPNVTATIVLFELPDAITVTEPAQPKLAATNIDESAKSPTTTTTPLNQPSSSALTTFHTMRDSLPDSLAQRVVLETISLSSTSTAAPNPSSPTLHISPAAEVLSKAQSEVGRAPKNAGDLVVMGRNLSLNGVLGRGRKGAEGWMESEAGKVLGGMSGWMVHGGPGETRERPGTGRSGGGAANGRGGRLGVGASLVVVKAGSN